MNKFKKVFPLSFKLGKSAKGFVWSIVLYTLANAIATVALSLSAALGVLLLLPSIFILPLSIFELLIVAFFMVFSALSMYATFGCGLSIMRFCGLFADKTAEEEKAE